MFKILTALMLVFSFGFVGESCSMRLTGRCDLLERYIRLLENVKNRLLYTNGTLSEVFNDEISGSPFSLTKDFNVQWHDYVHHHSASLKKGDRRLLSEFSRDLGNADISGALEHFEMYIALLKRNLQEAQREKKEKGKVYRVIGFSFGTALALLVM